MVKSDIYDNRKGERGERRGEGEGDVVMVVVWDRSAQL